MEGRSSLRAETHFTDHLVNGIDISRSGLVAEIDFQDHFGFAGSAIRHAMAGLAGNLRLDHGHGPNRS
jgi:hypothetical protein